MADISDPFDPSQLQPVADPPKRGRLPRHKPGEKFLKGPIPMDWIHAAGKLPGQALRVALELWFLAGCEKTGSIRITNARLVKLGISCNTARRAIQQLEDAKLIGVERPDGRSLVVTLNEVPEP